MPSYLTALSDTIKNSFGDWIAFETVIEPGIKLDHRRAQFVGLIYAEAAMNTVKYAFPNDAAGKMELRFRRLSGTFEMTVSDNGVGFDPATTARPRHKVDERDRSAVAGHAAVRKVADRHGRPSHIRRFSLIVD